MIKISFLRFKSWFYFFFNLLSTVSESERELKKMGVRNSKYGPGLMVDSNGQCMVQLGSCYNPYFSSQFQSSNSSQSCFIKPQNNSLLNAYSTPEQQQKLGTMSTYSCELPRSKAPFIPVSISPSFYKPSSPALNTYLGTRANYLKSPLKSLSPFYQKSLVKSFYLNNLRKLL